MKFQKSEKVSKKLLNYFSYMKQFKVFIKSQRRKKKVRIEESSKTNWDWLITFYILFTVKNKTCIILFWMFILRSIINKITKVNVEFIYSTCL